MTMPTLPTPPVILRTTALPSSMLDSVSSLTARRVDVPGGGAGTDDEARTELAIIAYFHRLTTQMLSMAADAVESSDDVYEDDDDEVEVSGEDSDHGGVEDVLLRQGDGEMQHNPRVEEMRAVRFGSRVVESMGLDVWNSADVEFVKELAAKYFGRRAVVEGKGVEVCGVRVC
jgi:hypothetical protein